MTFEIFQHLDLWPVPTVPELAEMGLARGHDYNKKGEPAWYSVTPEGDEMVTRAMLHNGSMQREVVDRIAAEKADLKVT